MANLMGAQPFAASNAPMGAPYATMNAPGMMANMPQSQPSMPMPGMGGSDDNGFPGPTGRDAITQAVLANQIGGGGLPENNAPMMGNSGMNPSPFGMQPPAGGVQPPAGGMPGNTMPPGVTAPGVLPNVMNQATGQPPGGSLSYSPLGR